MGDTKSHSASDADEGVPEGAGTSSQIRARRLMLLGNYELVSRLRVGGMAEVYTARDLRRPERIVALKRILPSFTDEADYVAMFIDEAKLGMRLKHPGIVESYELGQADDAYFIALEYVRGQDAAAILRRARETKAPVPVPIVCRIGIEVCSALQYAHELCDERGAPLGVVHRDVSPQNILVSYDGDVKLIDFGIAKSTEQLMRTQAGLLKGKHGYLSPEQAQGQAVDRRSDLFSLGVCLYELLAADRLFQGSSDFSTIVKVRNAVVPSLRELNPAVPDELAEILERALSRDRVSRFQSAGDMAEALVRFVEGSGMRCDREDVAAFMRDGFGDVPAGEAPPSDEGPREGDTGLLDAFDDLEPPSAVSVLAQMPEPEPQAAEATDDAELVSDAELLEGEVADAFEEYETPPDDGEDESLSASRRTMEIDESETTQISDTETVDGSEDDPAAVALRDEPTRVVAYESTHDGQIVDGEGQDEVGTQVMAGGDPSDLAETVDGVAPVGAATPPASGPEVQSSPALPHASTLPGLGMDWDDEELSTQLYDAPDGGPLAGRLPLPAIATPVPGSVPAGKAPSLSPLRASAPPSPFATQPGLPGPFASQPGLPAASTPSRSVAPGAPSPFASMRPPAPSPSLAPLPVPSVSLPPPRRSLASSMAPPALGRGALWWATSIVTLIVALLVFGLWLVREPARGSIHLTTDPADATVTMDGTPAPSSVSPFVLTDVAPSAPHEIEVRKAGYRTWKTQLTVRAGQMVELPLVRLMPETPPPATVPVLPPAVGPAPSSPQAAAPPTRAHAPAEKRKPVRPSHPTGAVASPKPRPVIAPSGAVSSPKPRPVSTPGSAGPAPEASTGGTGTLRINSRPWSIVYVDGRLVGNTPQMGIPLGAGRHTITLSNPEFGLKKTINVEIGKGETVTKIVDLQ